MILPNVALKAFRTLFHLKNRGILKNSAGDMLKGFINKIKKVWDESYETTNRLFPVYGSSEHAHRGSMELDDKNKTALMQNVEHLFLAKDYLKVVQYSRRHSIFLPVCIDEDNVDEVFMYCKMIMVSFVKIGRLIDSYLYINNVIESFSRGKHIPSVKISNYRKDLLRNVFDIVFSPLEDMNSINTASLLGEFANLPFTEQDELFLIFYIKKIRPAEVTHDLYLHYLINVKLDYLNACYFYYMESLCREFRIRISSLEETLPHIVVERFKHREVFMRNLLYRLPEDFVTFIEKHIFLKSQKYEGVYLLDEPLCNIKVLEKPIPDGKGGEDSPKTLVDKVKEVLLSMKKTGLENSDQNAIYEDLRNRIELLSKEIRGKKKSSSRKKGRRTLHRSRFHHPQYRKDLLKKTTTHMISVKKIVSRMQERRDSIGDSLYSKFNKGESVCVFSVLRYLRGHLR